jgi:hypothetical protein
MQTCMNPKRTKLQFGNLCQYLEICCRLLNIKYKLYVFSSPRLKVYILSAQSGNVTKYKWMYREVLNLRWPIRRSALHGDRYTAGCEAYINFADESIWILADNVGNGTQFIDHKMYWKVPGNNLYTSIANNCFVKKTQVRHSFLHLQQTRYQFVLDGAGLHGLYVDSVNSSCDYFAHLCIPASETTLQQKRMSIADRSHLRRQTVETKC